MFSSYYPMSQKFRIYRVDNRSLEERILSLRERLKPWEIEEKAMEEPYDIHDCIAKHMFSQNDFNKSLILDKMRKIFSEKQERGIYLLGMSYADKIKRSDLVEEIEKRFKSNYPIIGRIRSSLLKLYMEYYNPFDDFYNKT